MIKKNLKWVLLAAVCVLGWFAYFYAFYERVEYQENIPASYEVKNKIFYAAEKFLKSHGVNAISTKHRRKLIDLPETTAAIFIPYLSDGLSDNQVESLLNWVEQGGRLFVFADSDEPLYEDTDESENPILRAMHVRVVESSKLFPDQKYDYSDFALDHWMSCLEDNTCNTLVPPKKDEGNNQKNTTRIEPSKDGVDAQPKNNEGFKYAFDKDDELMLDDVVYFSRVKPKFLNKNKAPYPMDGVTLNLGRKVSLEVYKGKADVVFESESSVSGLQFYRGQGVISIFSDYDFLSHNYQRIETDDDIKGTGNHIGRYDHAYFLWQSVRDRTSVWFFESTEYTGFLKLALKNIPYFLITLALFTVVFLLWLGQRIGPNYASIDQPRRSILEHLQMSSDFEWRLDKCAQLLSKNQQALIKLIHSKHPKTKRLDDESSTSYLSERLGVPKTHIYTALFAKAENEKQFITISQYIQTLRNAL